MGSRMKNFNILGVHWKIQLLEGGSQKIDIEGGWGLGKKDGGGVFKGGWYTNAHYVEPLQGGSLLFTKKFPEMGKIFFMPFYFSDWEKFTKIWVDTSITS